MTDLACWLREQGASDSFVEFSAELVRMSPPGVTFNDDVWDILPWLKRVENSTHRNIRFDQIKHRELRLICKLWVVHSRVTGKATSNTASGYKLVAFRALSEALGARKFKTLKTDDFTVAERWLCERFASSYRLAGYLQQASRWLSISFNLRLEYQNRLRRAVTHGRFGTDEGHDKKLVPTEIIRDLLAARHRENLSTKDRFFLFLLAVSIATGFRVGELATLPANCLLKIKGGLHLLHYPEKSGKPVPRPIHPLLANLVEDAINNLLKMTSPARDIAKRMRNRPRLDWSRIIGNDLALRYFTAQWAHEWTRDPAHLMINPHGAWYTKGQCFIDAIEAYEIAGRNQSLASRNLGLSRATFHDLMAAQIAARAGKLPPVRNVKARGQTRNSWDTDQRVVSIEKFKKYCGTNFKMTDCKRIGEIIDRARSLQLQGKVFPAPKLNPALEERFQRRIRPLLRDSEGTAILYQDEALLVIQKYALSEQRGTKDDDFNSITHKSISRWLTGEARSRGTVNHEDSAFNRLGIVDPRTGEIAKFTVHDIRHWLNTVYQNGGLTEDQIALIFNRRYKSQNATYDQTSNKVRIARLRQAIRDKIAVGQVVESYSRLAEFSREDAEDYLEAVSRIVNPMPHGVCMLDWATTPCPHHLSCFSCRDKLPCEHLIIDPADKATKKELERMRHESTLVISAIRSQGVDDSPTIDHFQRITRNVGVALKEIRNINEKR